MSPPLDDYLLMRNASEAERLRIQHEDILSCQGYYFHPAITLPPTNARIADVATGTSAFLRDLAPVHPTAELHGFDISDIMFPSAAELPPNVQLHIANAKEPFESRWLGYFDFVHMRLIEAAMASEAEWIASVRNVTALLKPGGWLQWTEGDNGLGLRGVMRRPAPPGMAASSLSRGLADWSPPRLPTLRRSVHLISYERVLVMSLGVQKMDQWMRDVGDLEHVEFDCFDYPRHDGESKKRTTTLMVQLLWEMGCVRPDWSTQIGNVTREEWFEKVAEEIEMGGHWQIRMFCFVGMKKLQ